MIIRLPLILVDAFLPGSSNNHCNSFVFQTYFTVFTCTLKESMWPEELNTLHYSVMCKGMSLFILGLTMNFFFQAFCT